MIENYVAYLKFLDEKLARFFEQQKPYIFCKKGCGKCCKNARFPYSRIEVNFLIAGAMHLPMEIQNVIDDNISKVLEQKSKHKEGKFKYDCPFLINDECSVYEYRGIICRAFGLMTQDADKKIQVPFCSDFGLNYSNVMTDDGKNVSPEKFKKLGVKEEPIAFNVSYEFLTDADFARGFNFEFGETKPLIEWFIQTQ